MTFYSFPVSKNIYNIKYRLIFFVTAGDFFRSSVCYQPSDKNSLHSSDSTNAVMCYTVKQVAKTYNLTNKTVMLLT